MKLTWYHGANGRWPQHHHLHLQKNVNEEKQHKGVRLKTKTLLGKSTRKRIVRQS
jgi:hypothetical protein